MGYALTVLHTYFEHTTTEDRRDQVGLKQLVCHIWHQRPSRMLSDACTEVGMRMAAVKLSVYPTQQSSSTEACVAYIFFGRRGHGGALNPNPLSFFLGAFGFSLESIRWEARAEIC